MKRQTEMKSNKELGSIGLGCVTFGREVDLPTAYTLMHHATENGIFHFDTAAAYGEGASESIIGKWLTEHPHKKSRVKVATKLIPPYEPTLMRKNIEGSLQRLNQDVIDILYLHRWDPEVQNTAVLKCMEEWVQEGKIKQLGVSNFNTVQLNEMVNLQRQQGWSTVKYAQNNHNIAVSDMPAQWLELCKLNDINVVGYSPLGAGFLTGKHSGGVVKGTRFDVIKGHQDIYFNPTSIQRLNQLLEISKRYHIQPELLAMAWAMHHKWVDCTLVGARKLAHIDNALEALAFSRKELLSILDSIEGNDS